MEYVVASMVLLLMVSAGGESIVEKLISPVVDLFLPKEHLARPVIFGWASAAVSIALAFGFDLGLVSLLKTGLPFHWVDVVFTGILMGRGSEWLHNYFEKFVLNNTLRKEYIKTAETGGCIE